MQRPTNDQIGILSVSAVVAWVVFLVYFMLIGGYGFIAAVFVSLIAAAIVVALIYLFLMTSHGNELLGDASQKLKSAASRAQAEVDEMIAKSKARASESESGDASAAETAAPVAAPATQSAPETEAPPSAPQDTADVRDTETSGAAAKPAGLAGPRESGADDLKQIKGVGKKLEATLNELGYYHFDQIANWTAAEVEWVDGNLKGFKGRVSRDNWVEQAKALAAGG